MCDKLLSLVFKLIDKPDGYDVLSWSFSISFSPGVTRVDKYNVKKKCPGLLFKAAAL